MFSKDVVRTDRFLDMPLSAQALYFHLSLDADVKGFITPGLVMRLTRAQPDDLNVLIAKNFVIPFESGVIVVKDWNVNNALRQSREAPSQYVEEFKSLMLTEHGTYLLREYSRSSPGVLPHSIDEMSRGEMSRGEIYVDETSTKVIEEMRNLWKEHTGTMLRNHVEENVKAYRYLLKEFKEELPTYLQAVRMLRQDMFQKRTLQAKLINYIGLKERIEEVEAYMQAHVDRKTITRMDIIL